MRDLLVWVYLSGVLALLWYWRKKFRPVQFTEREMRWLVWLRRLYQTEESARG